MKLYNKFLTSIFVLLLLYMAACESSDIAMEEIKKTARVTNHIIVLLHLKEWSIAFEEYYKVNNGYPTTNSLVELKKILISYHPSKYDLYILDPWGEEYLVNSFKDSYVISSKGEDKTGSHEFGGAIVSESNNFSITLKNGVFVQYLAARSKVVKKHQDEIKAIKGGTHEM